MKEILVIYEPLFVQKINVDFAFHQNSQFSLYSKHKIILNQFIWSENNKNLEH